MVVMVVITEVMDATLCTTSFANSAGVSNQKDSFREELTTGGITDPVGCPVALWERL